MWIFQLTLTWCVSRNETWICQAIHLCETAHSQCTDKQIQFHTEPAEIAKPILCAWAKSNFSMVFEKWALDAFCQATSAIAFYSFKLKIVWFCLQGNCLKQTIKLKRLLWHYSNFSKIACKSHPFQKIKINDGKHEWEKQQTIGITHIYSTYRQNDFIVCYSVKSPNVSHSSRSVIWPWFSSFPTNITHTINRIIWPENGILFFPLSDFARRKSNTHTKKERKKIKTFSLRSFSAAIESRKIELNCVRMNEKLFKSFKMDLDYGRCDERLERI